MNIENCVVSHNDFGLTVSGGATMRVSNSMIASNTQGIFNDGASNMLSMSGNTLVGNPTPGSFTGVAQAKQ